jgi:hypothetical protein
MDGGPARDGGKVAKSAILPAMRGRFAGCLLFGLLVACGGATRSNPHPIADAPEQATGGAPSASTATPSAGDGNGAASAGEGGAASCGCVNATINWWVDDPARPPSEYVGKGLIIPCARYEYTASLTGQPAAIDHSVDLVCAGNFGVESINAALINPDVRAALAGSEQVFGHDGRVSGGQIDHIEVDGQIMLVGSACGSEPACNLPAGVQQLDHLLAAIDGLYNGGQ